MKIVLFIDNHSMGGVDISRLYEGNPGIGGTQYEMFLLAKLMIDRNKTDDFFLCLTQPQKGFAGERVIVLDTFDDVFKYCNDNLVDILIMRENKKMDEISSLKSTRVVFWIHNFISYSAVKKIGENKNVKRVIFVSKQHYDFYLEYNLNKKASYIFNSLAFPNKLPIGAKKENNVVFTGNIVPIKRLHLVTKIWPYIKKRVPDAKLFVIGTGANAHRNAKLGPYNLASEDYEKKILAPLIKTNTLDSVKFFGILGTEKNKLIRTAKVGVSPNKDETFCLSAAEYILNGVPVVGVKKGGINDVVDNGKTGLLHRSLGKIKHDLVNILLGKKEVTIQNSSLETMKLKFGFDAFYDSWLKTLNEIYEDKKVPILKPSNPMIDKAKWIGSFFRGIRKVFHLPEGFSRLGIYRLVRRNK